MDENPVVSVIVPVYKTELYLEQCVESILNQTYSNLEVILVDDGSPDRCPEICDTYASGDKRIQVIHKENGGPSSAREAGIKRATGDYLMVVDSDDWIDAESIAACIDVALRHNADCVIFGYVREFAGRSVFTSLFNQDFSYELSDSEKLVHRRIIGQIGAELAAPQQIDSLSSICMKLYRTSVCRNGRIVSERVVGTSEDTIFNLYALDGCKISYVNKCFYHYRKTNTQSITTQYKPALAEKWDVMYDIMQEYIRDSDRAETYQTPFLNRVACGMIGLGLNEISGPESLFEKSKKMRAILEKPLYQAAFSQLDTSYFDGKWKLFFWLCKKRWTFFLAQLLQIMNYLRSRMSA